jgi:cyanophycin synthetase
MRVEHTRHLRAPNVYVNRPVLVARLDLEHLAGHETTEYRGFAARLVGGMPALTEHHCARGEPGGFVARLFHGTYFGHVIEHVALQLSADAGRDVHFGRTRQAGGFGRYDVVLECPVDEPTGCGVAEGLVGLAVDVVHATLDGRFPDVSGRLRALAERWEECRPGPTTAALAAAARARGVPVERIGELSLLRLGYGRHRRLVWAALTDATSAIGVDVAGDKQLTRHLLADAALPVPRGNAVTTADAAATLLADLGGPVVVKPRHGRQGVHVHLNVHGAVAVRAAFALVATAGDVVVEQQFAGRDYRVLVVRGRVVAAAERRPAHVTGDGVRSVRALIAAANTDPRRGEGHARALTRLHADPAVMARQRISLADVPAPGDTVWLCDTANLSTGGTSRDVTDVVHPDVADLCRRAAEVVGLDVAGIDLRLPDIGAPLPPYGERVDRGIIEVNAAPGLRMHLQPVEGAPRDVATAIVDTLYPAGSPSRVPTIAITGTNGKTTTARLTAHLLAGTGLRVGVTTTDGVYVGGRLVQRADATGPRSAQAVLSDPTVDLAVLETARGGLLRQGLGYDHTDVGVVTNLAADHLGQDGIETIEDLVHVKALVAERVRDGGTLVLNADDPRVVQLIERPGVRAAHKTLRWFGLERSPLIERHVANGGSAYVLCGETLTELADDRETALVALADVPGSFAGAARFAAANALAAVAAARAVGLSIGQAAGGLRSFDAARGNPGRGQLFEAGGVYLLVDYAHNPAALAAMSDLMHRLWGPHHVVAAVTLPGDRRDDLLADCARVLADGFGRLVLYEDEDLRGRHAGELADLVRGEIAARRAGAAVSVVRHVSDAVPAALAMANPGDAVLVLYERIEPVLSIMRGLGARPVTDRRELARLRAVGVS